MTGSELTIGSEAAYETISSRVVFAVAEALDADPTEIEPLNDVVDLDALDRLFTRRVGGSPRTDGRVIFTVSGCEVTVHASGQVEVTPPDRSGGHGAAVNHDRLHRGPGEHERARVGNDG